MVTYNRILWNAPFFINETKSGISKSNLAAQLEYLISVGVIEIVMPHSIVLPKYLDNVDILLRNRVVVVDQRYDVLRKAKAVLSPICEEFKLKFVFPEVFSYSMDQEYPQELVSAINHLIGFLYPFMLGIEYNLQIVGDVVELKKDVSIIRRFSKNSNVKAILSILQGFLSSYEVQSIETFEIRSNAPTRSIEFFDELVRDTTYRSISSEFHSIGYPSRYVESITRIRKLCTKMVEKQAFKGIFNFATKVISAVTKIPMPSADISDALKVKEYFPPILNREFSFEVQEQAMNDFR